MVEEIENQDDLYVEEKDYTQYSVDYVKTMTALEATLHSCEDPAEIAMTTLKVAAEFYGGDWCGIIEGDLEMEAWAPVLWYDVETQGMTSTRFRELEETDAYSRWIEALYQCKPMIIPDTSIYKESNPAEYEIYNRCDADSILAVPFWKNPIGFMIVRNPKRYNNDVYESGFLQALAFVTFSAVTEQKLLRRTQKAFSPEIIKNDSDVIINLFGKLEIYTSKGVLTEEELNSPKISRFLVYLVLHRERPVPARAICDAIWPEEETDNPGGKIKNLAFRLQAAFGDIADARLVVSTSHGYQLNPELNIMTDLKMFEECWLEAQSALTFQTKIELLKRAADLYRGNVFASASSEHWLIPHELTYKYKCLGIYFELMKINFDSQNYANVQRYAALALEIEPANVDAYYWMIRSMKQKDSFAMAKGELKMAEHILTETEYKELVDRLEKAKDCIG